MALVRGPMCILDGPPSVVLFDLGATHSFIAKACVEKLGMSVEELGVDVLVSTPTSGLFGTSFVCARYPIVVERGRFKVNLISLPLQGLEVILRMDWLSINRILINCDDKEMSFPDEDKDVFVNRQDLLEGASCFLELLPMEVTQVSKSCGA
ncbi:uncharacterized protein LOC108330417 [Vigna angularis]|uniref:uncharacterized protein LOC108330417 n=1 Tax=Phaseolus angularis TaxID=3914 RepID=UPI00080A604C|nr:uncharacterized protein LOC108330417 [Vigna angularis]